MLAPIDLNEPPHLQFRLIPRGAMFLALHGVLSREGFQAFLARADVLQVLHLHRPTAAMVDLSNLSTTGPSEIEFATGWYFHQLASAGCLRVGLVLAPPVLATLGAQARELARRNVPSVQLELFDRQDNAVAWVQAAAAAPTTPRTSALPAQPTAMAQTAPANPLSAPVVAPPRLTAPPAPVLQAPAAAPNAALGVSQAGVPLANGAAPPGAVYPAAVAPVMAPPVVAPVAAVGPPVAPPAGAQPAPQASPLNAPVATTVAPAPAKLAPARDGAPAVLAVLRPASWPAASIAVVRSLVAPRPARADALPWISLAYERGGRRYTALRESDAGTELDAWFAEASSNIDAMPLEFEGRMAGAAGVPRMVRCVAPFAAEAILSPRHMRHIQEMLQADAVAVAIPVRGTLIAAAAAPPNPSVLEGLVTTARQSFVEAAERGLTPELFRVEAGRIVAVLATAPPEPPPPPPPAEPVVLQARTVAEANLYMDLRGAEPGARNHKLVQRGDDLLSAYECRVEGEANPQRFLFAITDVTAPPGALGGARPSEIISADQFLTWADILAKRVPPQAEGIAPEQRRRFRLDLQFAAACLEEVIKFIPPAADEVPSERLQTPAAQRKYKQDPTRFRRARLEAAAQEYRRLAELF